MRYTHALSPSASHVGAGISLYDFGSLNHKGLEIQYVDVRQGHDTFQISKKVTRVYYIVSGSGYFTIDNQRYDVRPGMVAEVPPKVEYSYSGNMKIIVLSTPRWFRGNDRITRWNPDVAGGEPTRAVDQRSFVRRLGRAEVMGKSPVRAYLRLNRRLWQALPSGVAGIRPVHSYGKFLNMLARLHGGRAQALGTFFLRNRPELELIRRLLDRFGKGETLRVAVLGCSTGAEAYSVAWTIKSARPELRVILHAIDISDQAVDFAKTGVYSDEPSKLTRTAMLERMTTTEVEELFDCEDGKLVVKQWVREGIHWHVGDVGKTETRDLLGPQDMVLANNFLCHMDPPDAEQCLRNIALLVRPQGYLFVGGVDLDVRTKVARKLGWNPVRDLLEEIHNGDPCLRRVWPCDYTGLEPLDKSREDWKIRYAAAFQAPMAAVRTETNQDEVGIHGMARDDAADPLLPYGA